MHRYLIIHSLETDTLPTVSDSVHLNTTTVRAQRALGVAHRD